MILHAGIYNPFKGIIGVLLRHRCAALVQPIQKKRALLANIEVISNLFTSPNLHSGGISNL